MGEEINMAQVTQKLDNLKPELEEEVLNGKISGILPELVLQVQELEIKKSDNKPAQPIPKQVEISVRLLHEQCRQLCLSVFYRRHEPVRSLGFTSSIEGEGKSFLSIMSAQSLAEDSSYPVLLVECNWERPSLHKFFGFESTPGLAEWLRGECSEDDIRHKADQNLTIIPAGDGKQDSVKLLELIRQKGLLDIFTEPKELLIVDLPAIVSTAYGVLAANLVETLVVVVRAGVTPDALVTKTCAHLQDIRIEGVILNQVQRKIPRWIRRIL